jgi:N-formylglutamate amidohydrolase
MALDAATRRREEDPFTARWTSVCGTRLVGCRSRFEVDLNRPRDRAVYRTPDDAWGLRVWREAPSAGLVAGSLAVYDAFHAAAADALAALRDRWGRFVVLDLHTYNHRRDGADAPPADPAGNPEVNVGTGSMDRARWAPVVERFVADLRGVDFLGRSLDVRENVRFRGGHFSQWVHERFPESGCALAIEFKKFFMDEWTGAPDAAQLAAIERALAATLPGLVAALAEVDGGGSG